MINKPKFSIIKETEIGEGTIVRDHVNLYKCKIGKNCKIGSFVYIEEGVIIGDNCKIKPFSFIPTGVKIGKNVLVGPGVVFTNDKYATVKEDWKLYHTTVGDSATIGAGSVIVPGVTIGKYAFIGAGSVVTKDIPSNVVAYGNPARVKGKNPAE